MLKNIKMKNINLNLDDEFFEKKIIVTGASRGLGAALCQILSQKGARVALFSRSIVEMNLIKKKMLNPNNHISVKIDLNNIHEIKNAYKKAKKFLKEIDIIIHVAGGGFGLKNALIKNSDLNTLLKVNLLSAIELNREAVMHKSKKKNLKLIHVGSIASSEAVGSVGYNLSKAALCSYVRSIGRELYKSNVLVTGILPGGFIAPGNAMERFKFKNNKEYKKFIQNRLPRGRMGEVEEILPVLLFLCSKYSSMMGGCMIPVDAGEGKAYQV